jgi:hypothetical protein
MEGPSATARAFLEMFVIELDSSAEAHAEAPLAICIMSDDGQLDGIPDSFARIAGCES